MLDVKFCLTFGGHFNPGSGDFLFDQASGGGVPAGTNCATTLYPLFFIESRRVAIPCFCCGPERASFCFGSKPTRRPIKPLALSRFLRRGAGPACKNRSAAPNTTPCFVHWTRSLCLPRGCAAAPRTGALNHRLLLLFAGCLQPQKLTLSIPAQSPGEGEVRSPEPPYGGGGAAAGEPLEGGWVGLDHPHGRAISLPPPHPPCASRFGRSCPRAAGPAGRAPAGHKRKIPAPGWEQGYHKTLDSQGRRPGAS